VNIPRRNQSEHTMSTYIPDLSAVDVELFQVAFAYIRQAQDINPQGADDSVYIKAQGVEFTLEYGEWTIDGKRRECWEAYLEIGHSGPMAAYHRNPKVALEILHSQISEAHKAHPVYIAAEAEAAEDAATPCTHKERLSETCPNQCTTHGRQYERDPNNRWDR
jgi:hypothetical protein